MALNDLDENEDVSTDNEGSDDDAALGSSDAALPAPTPMNPILKNYLVEKQAMANAQDQSRQNQLGVGIAQAAGTMANALAGGTKPVDDAPFKADMEMANAPVQNALAQQKAGVEGAALQKQLAEAQTAQASADPNSPQSIASRNLIKKLYPGRFDDATLQSLSAADIGGSIMKPLELDEKIQATKQSRADRASDRAQAQADKDDAAKDKAYTQMRKDLETFRGNQSAQQAAVKVQNADTALALIKGKDPNTLSTQDLRLLAEEMGKLASGGVAGEGATEALMPNTLRQKVAEMQSFLENKPTDAQAGDFIKRNMEYLDQMKQVAQGTLNRYRSSIAKGYKNRVKPEDYAEATSDYGLGAPTSSTPAKTSSDLQASVAAEIQKRQAARAQSSTSANFAVPNLSNPSGVNAQGVPASLQPNQPPGYAYGGMVGGLPASNFAAAHMNHAPKLPPLHLHSPRGYAAGGLIPGKAPFPGDNPLNDEVPIMASKGEVMLPNSVTQSKNPPLAAYLYMKHLCYGGKV